MHVLRVELEGGGGGLEVDVGVADAREAFEGDAGAGGADAADEAVDAYSSYVAGGAEDVGGWGRGKPRRVDVEPGGQFHCSILSVTAGDRRAADGEGAGRLECEWQRAQLPREIRDLVLEDQGARNAICWGVFGDR